MERSETHKGRCGDLELFRRAFLDKFFLIDLRDIKLVQFMNLRQRGMSFKEYSLKFLQLSMYAPTLVANSRLGLVNL